GSPWLIATLLRSDDDPTLTSEVEGKACLLSRAVNASAWGRRSEIWSGFSFGTRGSITTAACWTPGRDKSCCSQTLANPSSTISKRRRASSSTVPSLEKGKLESST